MLEQKKRLGDIHLEKYINIQQFINRFLIWNYKIKFSFVWMNLEVSGLLQNLK